MEGRATNAPRVVNQRSLGTHRQHIHRERFLGHPSIDRLPFYAGSLRACCGDTTSGQPHLAFLAGSHNHGAITQPHMLWRHHTQREYAGMAIQRPLLRCPYRRESLWWRGICATLRAST